MRSGCDGTARNLRRCGREAAALSALLWLAPLVGGYAQRPSGPTQNPLAGSWVFGAKGCANCHSINGVGKAVGPDLGRAQLHTYYDLGAAFWNHFPGMAARMRSQGVLPPRMSPGEMGDLIAFLTSVNSFDAPGSVEQGRTAFAQKGCIRCHQVAGIGGVIGPSLDYLGEAGPIQVAAAMWNHAPAMGEAMRSAGIPRPALTAQELADLLAYLRAASPGPADRPLYLLPGRADSGRVLVTEKGCPKCHSFRGHGGTRAPDLARRETPWSLVQFAAALWNKAPTMMAVMRSEGIAVPKFEPSEMADIIAYLYSIQYFVAPGNTASAPTLFRSRGCLGCHSLHGRGARSAPDLAQVRTLGSLPAVMAAIWNHVRLAARAESRTAWPKLTPEELADITAYFLAAGTAR